ncbi:uncharacterized protein LOC131074132 [Cryptomeria japonica]|uniref:uncharacterized protein LOC131074132 n=1 Tax=Cryptomeria japonica TaxID=3369 RepID=UPI0025AD98E5|nr:uncharacterized protein LOC131074132 [Cryptomeria japonica]
MEAASTILEPAKFNVAVLEKEEKERVDLQTKLEIVLKAYNEAKKEFKIRCAKRISEQPHKDTNSIEEEVKQEMKAGREMVSKASVLILPEWDIADALVLEAFIKESKPMKGVDVDIGGETASISSSHRSESEGDESQLGSLKNNGDEGGYDGYDIDIPQAMEIGGEEGGDEEGLRDQENKILSTSPGKGKRKLEEGGPNKEELTENKKSKIVTSMKIQENKDIEETRKDGSEMDTDESGGDESWNDEDVGAEGDKNEDVSDQESPTHSASLGNVNS